MKRVMAATGENRVLAVGLMSGTSLDGVDAALIETDGERVFERLGYHFLPYAPDFAMRLRGILGRSEPDAETRAIERDLTMIHAATVKRLLVDSGVRAAAVRVAGFHGHTVHHAPEAGFTWQIGDGALLARETGIPVVCDFRSADMQAGGEGAPLAPVFHAALAAAFERPVAVLNLGGVGNVTYIGEDGRLVAFDTGPGNALIDDWALRHTGKPMDRDGRLARRGTVDPAVLARLMDHPYFRRPAPKSLDRNAFDATPVAPLLVEDGAATLTWFTAAAVAAARDLLPAAPARWIVSGGGRRNPALMDALRDRLGVPVGPIEDVGWDGDAIEAQAFAFLSVRRLRGLPTSFPGTTGVARPTCGGVLHEPDRRAAAG